MALQVFNILALFSAVQGSSIAIRALGEIDIPDDIADDVYDECVKKPNIIYQMHVDQVARRLSKKILRMALKTRLSIVQLLGLMEKD